MEASSPRRRRARPRSWTETERLIGALYGVVGVTILAAAIAAGSPVAAAVAVAWLVAIVTVPSAYGVTSRPRD